MMTGQGRCMDVEAMCTRRVTSTVIGLAGISFCLSIYSFTLFILLQPIYSTHFTCRRLTCGFCCKFVTHRDNLVCLLVKNMTHYFSGFRGNSHRHSLIQWMYPYLFSLPFPPGEACVVTFQLLRCFRLHFPTHSGSVGIPFIEGSYRRYSTILTNYHSQTNYLTTGLYSKLWFNTAFRHSCCRSVLAWPVAFAQGPQRRKAKSIIYLERVPRRPCPSGWTH